MVTAGDTLTDHAQGRLAVTIEALGLQALRPRKTRLGLSACRGGLVAAHHALCKEERETFEETRIIPRETYDLFHALRKIGNTAVHEAAGWEGKLKVQVRRYFLQRTKTKWGSCNHKAGNIRLNTELVKKPKDLLEYVIVHEMAHLIEPKHSDRFIAILQENYPTWREARAELNELPLTSEVWKE